MTRQLCDKHQPEVAFAAAPGDPNDLVKKIWHLLDALIAENWWASSTKMF
jgi:hypothetical protein